MCTNNEDNKKPLDGLHNCDDLWFFQLLGDVQRLTMIGLVQNGLDGEGNNVTHQVLNLAYFFEMVEQALVDGRISSKRRPATLPPE
ncbi:MAG: hypothetical protein HRT61_24160 [Ekhidna sp.]|nr:hypothetical protein [Ekhidna sp.]